MNRSQLTEKEAFNTILSNFISCNMVLQIPTGLDSKVQEKDFIWKSEEISWWCSQRACSSKREHNWGGSSCWWPCSHADLNSSEICCITSCRVHKGQKCNPYCKDICWQTTKFHRPEFLGQRLLCINVRSWRRKNSSIHTKAGTIRYQGWSNEHVYITATFGWLIRFTALSGSQSILRLCRR